MRRGARDYLPKPFTPAQIRYVVEKVAERAAAGAAGGRAAVGARQRGAGDRSRQQRAGDAGGARRRCRGSRRRTPPCCCAARTGPARACWRARSTRSSARAARPFVTVNCPTLSEELLASELFGHARGAFTGAVRDQPGRVEAAEGGTLFLDEIGEISPGLQAKLLRFLQDARVRARRRDRDAPRRRAHRRRHQPRPRSRRARRPLPRGPALPARTSSSCALPPLRERREDILRLARRFLAFFAARRQAAGARALPRGGARSLTGYAWPGNVRELRNAIERALILWPARRASSRRRFPSASPASRPPAPRSAATHPRGDRARAHPARRSPAAPTLDDAARILGIDDSTLWRKRKRLRGC